MTKPKTLPMTAKSPDNPDISIHELLLSRKFICLMTAAFLAYANISVFFGFVDHLHTLPVDPADYGLLIGALAAVSLIVRPLISPFFHSGNAQKLLFIGTILAACSLAAYTVAVDYWSMLLVRIFHGIAFAVLGTALMTLVVDVIPKEKSAQFFGYLAVATLLPNTLIPPLLPFLDTSLGGFNRILLLFAALTLLMFPLVFAVADKEQKKSTNKDSSALSVKEVMENLTNVHVLRILAAMLLLYCGHAMVFFFLDGYGKSIQIAYVGIFLTFSTVGEIGIRVAAGSFFDRINKGRLASWSLLGLCLAYVLLAYVPDKWIFFSLGLIFGLGWGVAMPVFNGLMFDVSKPRFRAFNINLGLQMFQAGFFFGPLIGAPLLAGWGYRELYLFCAGTSLLAAVLMFTKGAENDSRNDNNT
ncbi:MAG: MFS transporter [Pseudomonadota bacterium]